VNFVDPFGLVINCVGILTDSTCGYEVYYKIPPLCSDYKDYLTFILNQMIAEITNEHNPIYAIGILNQFNSAQEVWPYVFLAISLIAIAVEVAKILPLAKALAEKIAKHKCFTYFKTHPKQTREGKLPEECKCYLAEWYDLNPRARQGGGDHGSDKPLSGFSFAYL